MSPLRPPLDRIIPALRKTASRMRKGDAVALSVVAVAAFGLAGLSAVDLPGPRAIGDGDRLRIEVVRPVEPDVVPGSVMEVGELVDGFEGLPPPLPPLTDVAWSADDGWNEFDGGYSPLPPEPRRVAETRTYESRPEPERLSPVRAVQRWFGFDAPRRDFQAERDARRARLDAMERAARERRDRERHAADRYAAERIRRERLEDDRYAHGRGRVEWIAEGGDDRRSSRSDLAGAPHDPGPASPPSGPRPYYDVVR